MMKQFVPQEVCLKCQGCCRFSSMDSVWSPYLLEEEIQELLDKDIPPALIDINRRVRPVPEPAKDTFICAFFNAQENKCKIYGLRPFECQLYPFLLNLRDGKVLLTVDLHCPYIKEKLESRELKEYIAYLSDYLNSPKQLQLLKGNPQILQAYEDVMELLELEAFDETK